MHPAGEHSAADRSEHPGIGEVDVGGAVLVGEKVSIAFGQTPYRLLGSTVLLPAPGVAVIYAMGAIFNPLGVALAAGTGGAIGEISGYLAGFSGQAVVERTEIYERVRPWVDRFGGWAILVLSAIPNPFFDIAGIAAGIAKMPLRTFLVFTWVGQLIKMLLFALAGKYSIQWLEKFFN